jgi:hypothetical protein
MPAKREAKAPRTKTDPPAAVDPRFAPVVAALTKLPDVTYGGKGFGSSGLKVGGKLFAMIASKGSFVAKLPRARVDELVRARQGTYFDPGHGRLMKEWIALAVPPARWLALAREAHRYVSGG